MEELITGLGWFALLWIVSWVLGILAIIGKIFKK